MLINDVENEKSCTKIPHTDKLSILILLSLYILQGIPLGLIGSTKILLKNKNVTYKDLALFSLSDWPFSIKLLWAPIVDSLYWKRFGRRKSWLIPTQFLLGISMLVLSSFISSLFGDSNNPPDIYSLTFIFFGMNFLAATQDIAVDGWALTMLTRENVGFASVCNSAGQRVGNFIGETVFLVFESPEFCNMYLRSVDQPHGLISFPGFLKFSGIIFIVSTLIILVFKSEKEDICAPKTHSLMETFGQLYHILCLKNILLLIAVLQTFQIAIAATDAVTKLKFIEAGVSKETVALLETPQLLVQIFLPFYLSTFLVGLKPLNIFLKAFPYKQ